MITTLEVNMQEILEPIVQVFWEYFYQPWIQMFLIIVGICLAGYGIIELLKRFGIDLLNTIWFYIKKKLEI